MAISAKDLVNLTIEDLEAALKAKKQFDRVGPLTQKRDRLAREKVKIEIQIARIEEKIAALTGEEAPAAPRRKPGRPPKAAKEHAPAEAAEEAPASEAPEEEKPAEETGKPEKKGKRTLSPEARARIVAAQKRRWAEFKAKGKTKAFGRKSPGVKPPKAEAPEEKPSFAPSGVVLRQGKPAEAAPPLSLADPANAAYTSPRAPRPGTEYGRLKFRIATMRQ